MMGRGLGVQPRGCVGGAQSPVGDWLLESVLAAAVATSAPHVPTLFPLEPGDWGCGGSTLRMLPRLRLRVGRPGPPRGQSRNCTSGGAPWASAAPQRPHACCSTDGTHRPGLVRKMVLFLEGSALRTLPGTEGSGLVARPPGVPRSG